MLLSCEHGGNKIPKAFHKWFDTPGARQALHSHRGYDPGALDIAQQLAKRLNVDLHFSEVSRLLIELNRSLDSPQLFSKFTAGLSHKLQARIIREHYTPLRRAVQRSVRRSLAKGSIPVHISVHTFTPRFPGSVRNFDVGVLFDPTRLLESRLSRRMIRWLNECGLRSVANRPYLGTADGHTTELRSHFPETGYVGIELEINNRISRLGEKTQQRWLEHLANALTHSLGSASTSR
jgi:predicted N-formylglutamate amidohydrolase